MIKSFALCQKVVLCAIQDDAQTLHWKHFTLVYVVLKLGIIIISFAIIVRLLITAED